MAKQTVWQRTMMEGVVIVTSILFAFAIQASWEERGERRVERVYLLQLQADLERAEEELASAAAFQESAGQSVLMILAASQEAEPPPNDSLHTWLGDIGFLDVGVPTLSTAEGLLASNALQSIESMEVRSGLIRLVDQLVQMERWQGSHQQLFMQGLYRLNRMTPALSRGMSRYVGLLGNPPDSLTRETRVDGSFSIDLRPFLRDPDFVAVVDELWISHENIRYIVQGMLDETRIFRATLDQALSGS